MKVRRMRRTSRLETLPTAAKQLWSGLSVWPYARSTRLILQHVMHNESQARTLCSVSVTGTSKEAEQCAHPWRPWDKQPSAKQQEAAVI
ncbi:hypothetical protein V8C34DRAFT_289888 [Trichoderma compactum]